MKLVGLLAAAVEEHVEAAERLREFGIRQPQPNGPTLARSYLAYVVRRGLGSGLRGIDGWPAVDDEIVDAVFNIRRFARNTEKTLRIGVVFRKEQVRRPVAVETVAIQLRMFRQDGSDLAVILGAQSRP